MERDRDRELDGDRKRKGDNTIKIYVGALKLM